MSAGDDPQPRPPLIVLVGLPEQLRGRVLAAAKDVIEVKIISMATGGRPTLAVANCHTVNGWLESWTRAARDSGRRVVVVRLPYPDLPARVEEFLYLLRDVEGFEIVEVKSDTGLWPKRSHVRAGQSFLDDLSRAVCRMLLTYVEVPTSVFRAVAVARSLLSEDVAFGSDVDRGIGGLDPAAGPPEKVLKYLTGLADASSAKRSGTLGTDTLKWLTENGVRCSSESATIRSSKKEKSARTWDFGGTRAVFYDHLKPTEGTSPDRCVRVYFAWCDRRAKHVVGWVGRHP